MRGGSLLLFFCSCFIFSLPLRSDRGRFSRLLFFSSLSLLLFVFFGCSDGMEREACVCDHGYERSDLSAEIIIIIIIITTLLIKGEMEAAAELGRNPVSKHQIQPEYGDEQADAGRDCRTRLARPNSQARTRTGKYSFFLFS